MNNQRIMQQFHAMFGIFMVIFYIGVGIFFLFFANRFFIMNKAIWGLMGGTFMLYGVYRIFVTYKQIIQAFFKKNKEDEE